MRYIKEILETIGNPLYYDEMSINASIYFMDADKTLDRLGIIKPVEDEGGYMSGAYALPYDSRGDGTTSGYIIYVDEEVSGYCPHSHELLIHVFSSDELRTLKNALRKGVRIS